jgi:hypothetical protein
LGYPFTRINAGHLKPEAKANQAGRKVSFGEYKFSGIP